MTAYRVFTHPGTLYDTIERVSVESLIEEANHDAKNVVRGMITELEQIINHYGELQVEDYVPQGLRDALDELKSALEVM